MKFKLGSDKKGYVQVDFTFAAFIFFTLFLIIFSFYESQRDSLEDLIQIEKLNADSRDLCYLFSATSGYPINWQEDVSSLSFPGLKSETNASLDSSKIAQMSSTNYFTIIDQLNVGDFVFLGIVGVTSGNNYLDFGVIGSGDALSSSYTCYGDYNGEVVKLTVEIWD